MPATTSTELETGWRPDTPVGDTVLRRFVHSWSSSWASTAACGGRVVGDDRFAAADIGRPTGMFNSATLLQPLQDDDLDNTVDAIGRFYETDGTGRVLLWSPWPTPDLQYLGWELDGHPPMLLRPPSLPVDQPCPEELTIVEVHDREGLEDWCAVAVDGFPFVEVQPYRPGDLLDERVLTDDRFRFQVGYVDGRATCIGSQYVEHGLNILFLAVTRPDARGRGYYRAMAAYRVATRPDLPDAAVVSDMSRPVLVDRLGFLPITRFTLWARPRP